MLKECQKSEETTSSSVRDSLFFYIFCIHHYMENEKNVNLACNFYESSELLRITVFYNSYNYLLCQRKQ